MTDNTDIKEVDVVVLGVGTSGEDLSLQLLDAGLDVVGIEASLVGAECPYWACLPSKVMIRAANMVQEARRIDGMAGRAKVHPDWAPVAERVRQTTGGWDDSAAVERYHQRGGRLIHGRGRLTGPDTVAVNGEEFRARRGVVIATGSKPFIPPIEGLEEVDYWTTHEMIEAERLPRSMLILGASVVGCELGQMLSRFGVDITIIEAADRLLPGEEEEASQALESTFEEEGIAFHRGALVQKASSPDGSISLTIKGGEELRAERLLIATGRTVDLEGLGLETAGIDRESRFLEVDEQMRAAEGIWAMGDITGKALFTHLAVHQSTIVAAEILGKDHLPAQSISRRTPGDLHRPSGGRRGDDRRAGQSGGARGRRGDQKNAGHLPRSGARDAARIGQTHHR